MCRGWHGWFSGASLHDRPIKTNSGMLILVENVTQRKLVNVIAIKMLNMYSIPPIVPFKHKKNLHPLDDRIMFLSLAITRKA